jgi:hypothetical protein
MADYFARRVAVLLAALALPLAACGGATPNLPTIKPSRPESVSRPPVCSTSQLRITVPWTGAAAGTVGGRIAFTNLAASPCHLQGWPVLAAVTAQGRASKAIDGLSTMFGPGLRFAPLVTLRHGATGEAVFTGGDEPGPGETVCPPSYRFLRVTPPGNSRTATLPAWIWYYDHDMPACTGIWVSPVVPWTALYQGRQDNDRAGRAFSKRRATGGP